MDLFDLDKEYYLPKEFLGKETKNGGLTKNNPRKWTEKEIEWALNLKAKGFKNKDIAKKDMEILKNKKEKTQPARVKTGGSTFKNPITQTKEKVWKLIKSSVQANTSFGDAAISEKHSNFFVNKNNATYEDMKKLIDFVRNSVREKTGINLDLEIEIVG